VFPDLEAFEEAVKTGRVAAVLEERNKLRNG
jgi:hypothetical protein